jgi:hypothetical protein
VNLIHLYIDNACRNGFRELDFKQNPGRIAKWRLLPAGKACLELLRLITAGCAGVQLFEQLSEAILGGGRGVCQRLLFPGIFSK